MRKVIVSNMMSLDGFFEGEDKNVGLLFQWRDVYPSDDSFDRYNAERLRSADILLTGKTSYEGFSSYWPDVQNNPNEDEVQREISRLNNAIEKIVISDSLKLDPAHPWHSTTRVVSQSDAHKAIADLKQQDGKDILIFGSQTLWSDLLAHGLVDEIHLIIAPLILGSGTRMFDEQSARMLRRADTTIGDDSGTVIVKYEVINKDDSASKND